MPQQKRKHSMPKMTVSGSYRPETLNREERTVEMVFTTGESGLRYDWDIGQYMEEIDVTTSSIRTDRLEKGLPILDNHDRWSGTKGTHGITENYRIENGQIIGTARFASDAESNVVFEKVADGILRSVSLGYKVHAYRHTKGTDGKIDTLRATDWEPLELSIVPVPFEKGTSNGVRAERHENETTYDVEIISDEERNMPEENKPVETEQRSAETAPVVTAPAVTAPQVQPETRNLNDYITAAKNAGMDVENATDAYSRGDSIDAYRADVLKSLGEQNKVILQSDERADQSETTRKDAENFLAHRAGDSSIVLDDGANAFRGMTLMEIAKELTPGLQRGMSKHAVATRAFNSTSNFPLLLENVMNKFLQNGYTETERTFLGLGRRSSVSDFREKHTYKVGDFPSLKKIKENAEYEAGTFSESKESYSIDTFARKIGFTRQMLINDDLDAVTAFSRKIGQAGSRLESDVVWGLLLNYDFAKNAAADFKMSDNKPFYDAAHKNLLTASSALSETSLSEARKLGRNMKTLDNHYMNITWDTMVFPQSLETTAEKLLLNTIMATTTGDTNSFRNKYDFRIEPRLEAVSATAWYMFTKMVDSFEYAYLDGNEGMFTETIQSNDIDGVTMLARKDFGAGYIDERGSMKATGAA